MFGSDALPVLMWVSLLTQAIVLVTVIIILRRQQVRSDGAVSKVIKAVHDELREHREDETKAAQQLREELTKTLSAGSELAVTTIGEMGKQQTTEIQGMSRSNEGRLDKLRDTIDQKLGQMQQSNEAKLEEMRKTVDEKLHETLEKRLGESFSLVSKQLEAVQSGLGEMRNLATGVGDLKKVLSGVKTRGTLGEVQLEAIIEDILTTDQYEKNVHTKPGSRDVVEFAVKFPGPDGNRGGCVWLPIDSKFPMEDYERIIEASEAGDAGAMAEATKSLVRVVRGCAKDIHDKYVNPPATTDVAILFLPTEGLYAEILRQPGLVEDMMHGYRIMVAGPTTLSALLSSLRMGFRTLAIEQHSSEVWQVLAAVKAEFGKFGGVLDKLKKQLSTASKTVDETGKRTRAMERKLKDVEDLPEVDAAELLQLGSSSSLGEDESEG